MHPFVMEEYGWRRFGAAYTPVCCIGAAAAVAATVATVASVGLTAAKAAGAFGSEGGAAGGAAGGGYVAPSLRERMFSRATASMLDAERQILDDSIAQGKMVEPELYRALGLEPIYDRPEDPELSSLSSALAGKQSRLQEIRQERATLQSQRGRGKKGRQKSIRQLNRESALLNKEIAALSDDVEQRGAVGRRIVGFRNLPGVADPTGSTGSRFGGVLDEFNAHLDAALSGREPLDPTLANEFLERESNLRERLRRNLGPDYETTTAGSDALKNFDREKAEAFAQYNRQSIEGFSKLAESRAGALSELTGARMRNLAFPATLRGALGQQLEGAAEARSRYLEGPAEERAGRGRAAMREQERRDAERAERDARLEALLGMAAGGLGGLGSGLSGFAPAAAAPAAGSASVPGAGFSMDVPGGASGVSGSFLQ